MPDIQILGALHNDDGSVLPGWHINSTAPLAGLDAHRVEPSTPRALFAGVPTYFYVFDTREQAEQLLPVLGWAREQPLAIFAAAAQL